MSELSRQARKANRDKAERLTRADPHQKVDASSWTPPAAMDTEEQTGAKPISRQARKHGGKVEGEGVKARADHKPRTGPKREYRDVGGEVPTQRFQFQQGPSRLSRMAGLKTGGGLSMDEIDGTRPTGGRHPRKDGGKAHFIKDAIKHPGALHKEFGVPEGEKIPAKKLEKAAHSKNPTEAKRAHLAETLERMPRKDGGRANKGKTNINIIIDAGKGQPQGGPPPMPMPMPPRPPMPMPQPAMAGPPPMGAPPMPPGGPGLPPGMTPPMPRKRGGRAYFKSEAGAGSGLGRMQKTEAC